MTPTPLTMLVWTRSKSYTNFLLCNFFYNFKKKLLPPANEVCEGYIFTGVCLSTGGACMAGGSVRGRECAWLGVCMAGGHAWRGVCMVGACMVGGCAWQGGMHGGGIHGRGPAWQGACMAGGVCMPCMPPPWQILLLWHTVNERRYASYWNAFLFRNFYFPNNSKSADSFILSRNSDFGEEI